MKELRENQSKFLWLIWIIKGFWGNHFFKRIETMGRFPQKRDLNCGQLLDQPFLSHFPEVDIICISLKNLDVGLQRKKKLMSRHGGAVTYRFNLGWDMAQANPRLWKKISLMSYESSTSRLWSIRVTPGRGQRCWSLKEKEARNPGCCGHYGSVLKVRSHGCGRCLKVWDYLACDWCMSH